MRTEVKTKKSVTQTETFKLDGVFYSFKYDHQEIIGEGSKFFELKSPITVLVETPSHKKMFFAFKADLVSTTTYGKLSVIPNVKDKDKDTYENGHKKDNKVNIDFNSLIESNEFTNILNTVHAECIKIISSKFKDSINQNDPKDFFQS